MPERLIPVWLRGGSSNIPKERYVWLAVQIGNLRWPRDTLMARDRTWLRTISQESSPGNSFAVILIMIDASGHREIQNRHRRGVQGQVFPGIEQLEGGIVPDAVQVVSQG